MTKPALTPLDRRLVATIFVMLMPLVTLHANERNFEATAFDIEGRYARVGVVDPIIEAQFKGVGLVLVRPVSIDELLFFSKRGTHEDIDFIVKKRAKADYVMVLEKADVTCVVSDIGNVVELPDKSIVRRRAVTLTGEGSSPIPATQEEHITREKYDSQEWLVVYTRIEMVKRSWFRSQKVEYRSLVRFLAK